MKKETVSNGSLKEKIEEILTPYPDPMSRNDFRIVCHIGTRTSLYLLQSGLVLVQRSVACVFSICAFQPGRRTQILGSLHKPGYAALDLLGHSADS